MKQKKPRTTPVRIALDTKALIEKLAQENGRTIMGQIHWMTMKEINASQPAHTNEQAAEPAA